jgi:hypothetical protein
MARIVSLILLVSAQMLWADPMNVYNVAGSYGEYESRSRAEETSSTYLMPIILPLEAEFGRFLLGGSVDNIQREYQANNVRYHTEGIGYVSLNGKYDLMRGKHWKVSLNERWQVSVPDEKRSEATPGQVRLNEGSSRLLSSVAANYYLDRMIFGTSIGHVHSFSRGSYITGDRYVGSISMGYGIGERAGQETFPVAVELGLVSRYYKKDYSQGRPVTGSQYGTLYVAPAVQFSSSRVLLEAGVELPIQQFQSEENSYRDKMRANLGLKYYFK